jgi:hypothetical protein
MSRLHPAIRIGLIWACVHQAWMLVGIALLWANRNLFMDAALGFFLPDIPAFYVAAFAAPKYFDGSGPPPLYSLTKLIGVPHVLDFAVCLTLGALQWFLIGATVSYMQQRPDRECAALKSKLNTLSHPDGDTRIR